MKHNSSVPTFRPDALVFFRGKKTNTCTDMEYIVVTYYDNGNV